MSSRRFSTKAGRGFAAIGLVQPKTPANVGGVMRAAGCYGAATVIIEGERGMRSWVRASSLDTAKAWRHMPALLTDDLFDAMPVGCTPVAVDLLPNAVSLVDFAHPETAFYIFGPEDGTLGERHAKPGIPRVYVPTAVCMNLASTVNVVLYDRMAKMARARALEAA